MTVRPDNEHYIAHTPGPWTILGENLDSEIEVCAENAETVLIVLPGDGAWADAKLAASSPALIDALAGLYGLTQLLLGRDDLTPELRDVLKTNHRVEEARAVLSTLKAMAGADNG